MNVQAEGPGTEDSDPKTRAQPPVVDQQTLDRIFGRVLPESTKDDLDSPSGSNSSSDDWYRSNRPPHHGG